MKLTMLGLVVCAVLATGCVAQKKEVPMDGIYGIEVVAITGETIRLGEYKGKVLLIVNTASKCGFTGQYEGLQKLYETHRDQGFVVLGFPSNDFLKQEPGTNEEIASFCKQNHGVTFPMFGKVSVKGKNQHPLYTYLTSRQANPQFSGRISWNFNKFLISRDGQVVGRFGSRTPPSDEKLAAALQAALQENE